MIKMTIVTDSKGNLIGAISGEKTPAKGDTPSAEATFASGYKLHPVEVPADMDMHKVTDTAAFEKKLHGYLSKA